MEKAESAVSSPSATPRNDTGEMSLVGKVPLFSLDGIDLNAEIASKEDLHQWIPHRDAMSLMDHLVWESGDLTQAIASWTVRPDEFWVSGHFPGNPLLPGILMVEAGAQLGSYLFSRNRKNDPVGAFTRIDHATFRSSVRPDDRMLLLAQKVRLSSRGFTTDVQGVVDGQIAFEARVTGIDIKPRQRG